MIHSIVRMLKLESFFYLLSALSKVFLKFIPTPDLYNINDNVVVNRSGLTFKIDRSDYMQWSVYADETDRSHLFARDFHLPSANIIVDIGSNFGAFSLKTARMFYERDEKIEVHAFEPNSIMVDRFIENVDLNPKLKPLIKIHNFGLGKAEGLFSLKVPSGNSGAARLIESSDSGIEVKRFDNWVDENNLNGKISFVKIDVEGWEMDVLLGAENSILGKKIPLYCEVTDKWLIERGYSEKQLLNKLLSYNYKILIDDDGELIKLENRKAIKSQYNILAY